MCSCSGSCNCNSATIPKGPAGTPGQNGLNGSAATIAAGTASPLAFDATPTVTNVGTSSAAVFNFGIPVGEQGIQGPIGDDGINAFSSLSSSSPRVSRRFSTLTFICDIRP